MRLGRGLSLLLGGARSGKSDLAVRLGESWEGDVTFVATATAGDDDMAARITRHQNERPSDWQLIEQEHFSSSDAASLAGDALVIIDCFTLLVSNLLFSGHGEASVIGHVSSLGDALAARTAPTIAISNEVGLGIHPETPLGREYRDILGRANRALAQAAETTLFVAAGKVLPLTDLDTTWP